AEAEFARALIVIHGEGALDWNASCPCRVACALPRRETEHRNDPRGGDSGRCGFAVQLDGTTQDAVQFASRIARFGGGETSEFGDGEPAHLAFGAEMLVLVHLGDAVNAPAEGRAVEIAQVEFIGLDGGYV